MTQLQIEYFIALAQHMSFSQTAAVMYVSQAAVSRQIAALEQELGLTLFSRRYRGLSLTVAGEIMLELFSRHRRELDEALQEAHKHQTSENLRIEVGLLEGLDFEEIYLELLEFQRLNPRHQINITVNSVAALMEGLMAGAYDVVFTFHQELHDSDYLDSYPALSARFQIFLSADHILNGRENLSLADLAEETFCAPITDNERVKKEYCNRVYSVCGLMPKRLVCKPNLDSVISEVQYNNCVAMLYNKTRVVNRERFTVLETESYNHISLLRAKGNNNPLVGKLIRHLSPKLLVPPDWSTI